ncbi:hypothetical protein AK812_SmicGene36190 [Symbiodinium microadriaticum]|uniref:Uncharacterized protein n=1 Tax=Symbiodinium microadriaticum TaxID=2951 RepID=A0A1Q9CJI5_SYMMI|nr:hypothetical protein AK812_SmicGene36190 [Symbiodinium microadriaticum]
MARESEPVILSGLGAAWYGNPEVRDRLSFEAPSSLILPASGEKVPIASQETAVVNDMFLIPIIIQMRAASSLKIPSLETIAEELEALWIKYHEDEDYRRMVANFGNKADYPELDTLRADASVNVCDRGSLSHELLDGALQLANGEEEQHYFQFPSYRQYPLRFGMRIVTLKHNLKAQATGKPKPQTMPDLREQLIDMNCQQGLGDIWEEASMDEVLVYLRGNRNLMLPDWARPLLPSTV